jgi:hypothetical protein
MSSPDIGGKIASLTSKKVISNHIREKSGGIDQLNYNKKKQVELKLELEETPR